MRTLAGYSDKISVCPGDTIAFKVSAEDGSGKYAASLVRLHCVDSIATARASRKRQSPVPSKATTPHAASISTSDPTR